MFRAFAELTLTVALDADRACIAFSFPCSVSAEWRRAHHQHGQGIARHRRGEGKLVCEGIETAMRALGASGARRWRLIMTPSVSAARRHGIVRSHRATPTSIGFDSRHWLERLLPCEGVRRQEIARKRWRWAGNVVNLESGPSPRCAHGGYRLDETSGCPGDHQRKPISEGILLHLLLAKRALAAAKDFSRRRAGRISPRFSVMSAMVDAFVLTTLTLLPIYRLSKTEKGPPRRFQNQHDASRRFRLSSPLSLLPFCNAATRDALTQHTRQDDTRSCAADGSADRRYTKQHSLGGAEFLFAGDARRNAPGQHGVNKNSLVKGISK